MDRTERFYKIDHLIRERGVVPAGPGKPPVID
jgi:hypothetical protein